MTPPKVLIPAWSNPSPNFRVQQSTAFVRFLKRFPPFGWAFSRFTSLSLQFQGRRIQPTKLLLTLFSPLIGMLTGMKYPAGMNCWLKLANGSMAVIAMSSDLISNELSLASQKGTPSKGSRLAFLARFDGGVFLSSSSSEAFRFVGVEGVDVG
jgi:hypothetical protein